MSGSRSGWCTPAGTGRAAPTPTSTAGTCGTPSPPATSPEWELGLQLFGDDFADRFGFDILDPTKIVPEE